MGILAKVKSFCNAGGRLLRTRITVWAAFTIVAGLVFGPSLPPILTGTPNYAAEYEAVIARASGFLANPLVRILFAMLALWLFGRAAASIVRADDQRARENLEALELARKAGFVEAQAIVRDAATLPSLFAKEHVLKAEIEEIIRYQTSATTAMEACERHLTSMGNGQGIGRANIDNTQLENGLGVIRTHLINFIRFGGTPEDWTFHYDLPTPRVDIKTGAGGMTTGRAFNPEINEEYLRTHNRNLDRARHMIARIAPILAAKQAQLRENASDQTREMERLNGRP